VNTKQVPEFPNFGTKSKKGNFCYARVTVINMINVQNFGAVGDGKHNDYAAIQQALDAGERDILIPAGTYVVDAPLQVPSARHIHADVNARIVFIASKPMTMEDFLITNADVEDGNEDITIEGGIWDGGFGHPFNRKSQDIYEIKSTSGACMNFVTVKHLRLLHLTVANPIAYYIRTGRISEFEFRDITLTSTLKNSNQDGIHFSGYCRNGLVEDIRAVPRGQTNDDLLAFNADDGIQRQENRGLTSGPIENIVCRNIYAENCHSAIRMSSITSAIRNIRIDNIYCGCRVYALNMDALRYCRVPLFREDAAPNGVGNVSDVVISNMTAFYTEDGGRSESLIVLEQHCDNFELVNFSRPLALDAHPELPLLKARYLTHQTIEADGKVIGTLTDKQQECIVDGDVHSLKLTC